MIIIMERQATDQETKDVIESLDKQGVKVQVNSGVDCVVLGVLGHAELVEQDQLRLMPGVEKIIPVQEPYKKANRKLYPQDTQIEIGRGVTVGGKPLVVIAGPCSVESLEQMQETCSAVKAAGAKALRGGAYKPRTSPYAFQGMKKAGIEILQAVRQELDLPIVTELTTPRHVEMFEVSVDVIQIGARNMQNFELLKEVGGTRKPILLKRGLSNTIEEFLMSAEYIMSQGNPHVILCERGIRTFERYTRNTMDISAIPALKKLSHLPVFADPSHATGRREMVEPMALAAIAAGVDGLLIEVHNDPANALCDGPQSLEPTDFAKLMAKCRQLAELMGREI
ncbi:MAG: 3-deoxy-7-phosphoheptulonate synthase [Bacillota bacterium]|jgi:3-deoxy-7-phosphoheptulonate synthase